MIIEKNELLTLSTKNIEVEVDGYSEIRSMYDMDFASIEKWLELMQASKIYAPRSHSGVLKGKWGSRFKRAVEHFNNTDAAQGTLLKFPTSMKHMDDNETLYCFSPTEYHFYRGIDEQYRNMGPQNIVALRQQELSAYLKTQQKDGLNFGCIVLPYSGYSQRRMSILFYDKSIFDKTSIRVLEKDAIISI